MGFSPETYAVARKYTDDTVAGAGALAGKPCQIQSITDITGGHRVTFLWVDNLGTEHTSTMDVMDGEKGDNGLGIKSVAVNSSNHLIVTYDDDTTEDAGEMTLDTSDFVQKSSTAGLLKNDGTVDTTDYTVVSYTQTYSQSGQKIGEITIDGTTTDVVAPTGGGSEHGIPSGGTSGQILSKKSSTDYDVQWTDAGTASQVQANWDESDSTKVDYIKNKPANLVQDANYVHTDYNYDATAKGIVDGIPLTIQQLQGSLLTKVDKVQGKGLSTNDYSDADKTALQTTIPLEISQLQGSLLNKVDKEVGKGLSTNDYDNTAKTKLDGLANIKSVGTGLSLNGTTGELTATGGGGTWGSITGTLSDQTDLQNALDGKQATLTFDNAPTENSDNPVKSDGIYDAISDVYGVMAVEGVHQYIPFDKALMTKAMDYGTWNGNVFTVNGGTVTINPDDETVTIDGTFSETSEFRFFHRNNNSVRLPDGDYIVSGGKTGLSVVVGCTRNGGYLMYTQSTGADAPFTILSTDGNTACSISISAGTYTNVKIEPLIRRAADTYTEHTCYAMTNRELTEAVSNIPTVTVTHTGTASSTTARKQQITVNNVAYDVDGSMYMEQEVILSTSADTVVTFTNNELIVDGKMFTVATSIWDLVPTSIVTSTGSCVITFPKQTNAATIGVRLYVR